MSITGREVDYMSDESSDSEDELLEVSLLLTKKDYSGCSQFLGW